MSTEATRNYSTSPDLSSPPKSPDSPHTGDTIYCTDAATTVTYPTLAKHDDTKNDGGEDSSSQTIVVVTKAARSNAAPPVVKKTRKKRESATGNAATSAGTEVKEKKTRKPRATASSGASAPAKKRLKSDVVPEPKPVVGQTSRQPRITELVGSPQPLVQLQFTPNLLATVAPSRSGKFEAIVNDPPAPPVQVQDQSAPRSGQNYDPIRSSTVDPPKQFTNPFSPQQSSPLRSTNRASASPSISSLIDPPTTSPMKYQFVHASNPPHPPNPTIPLVFSPPPDPHLTPLAPLYGDRRPQPQVPIAQPSTGLFPSIPLHLQNAPPVPAAMEPTAMEIDSELQGPAPVRVLQQSPRKASTGTSTGPPSTSHSPKPPRPKDKDPLNLPPLPPGNGLLSSSLFGGPASTVSEKQAPTVILHVPLNGEINKYINFARLAEERYGFNALHPRLAAQRERLARVAAAGALLEKASNGGTGGQSGSGISADEMSLELSDGEGDNGDSNVEMGGIGSGPRGTDGGDSKEGLKPVRKRRMKEDQYDKEDPFVDDSELAWEEQAAASKDGFFVYSGPLVPEGEKPQVERADGTIKRGRGGRGRGGASTRGTGAGRGGAGRGGATGGASSGTRGQGTTRKPRKAKAARAQVELEKASPDKMALLAAKPVGYLPSPGQP